MRILISFFTLLSIKIVSRVFYRFEVNWINGKPSWDKIRLISFLNHTSLYEPVFIGIVPLSFLWRLARKLVAPAADKTLNRPFVGRFWKIMSPGMITITRKRDHSWKNFMQAIKNKSVIVIAAEGRMKRATGLDLMGKKMTVKAGVTDILELLNEGNMMMAYSGGLHHIQIPGQKVPKLFKKIRMNIDIIPIHEYKSQFSSEGIQWKKDVVADMQKRLETCCPEPFFDYPNNSSI